MTGFAVRYVGMAWCVRVSYTPLIQVMIGFSGRVCARLRDCGGDHEIIWHRAGLCRDLFTTVSVVDLRTRI